MITAGIDRARILVGAIEATDYDVVKAVVGNSSRTTPRVQLVATAARAIALAEGRASIAEMLLLLGAESAEERIATAQTLVMMGAGPVDASRELPVERMDELV